MDKELAFLTAALPDGVSDSWQTYPYFLCGVAGYALYLAWLFTHLVTPAFLPGAVSDVVFAVLCHAVFLLSFAGMLLAGCLLSNAFSTRKGTMVLALMALLFGSCAPMASFVQAGVEAIVVSWALAGVGGGCLLLLAAPFLCSLGHKRLVLFASLGVAAGVVLFMGMMYLADFAKACAVAFAVMLSVGLFLSTKRLSFRHVPLVSAAESKERSRVSWKSTAAVLGNSICMGFMLYCASFAITVAWRYGVLGLAAVAAAVVMACDVDHDERLNEETQLKLFLPCAVLGFLPIPFFGSWGALAGCLVLVLVFCVQFITNLSAVSENVYLFKLSPVRSFSAWRLWNIVGILLGYGSGFVAFDVFGREDGIASLAVLFVLLALLIVLATFFYQNRYPSPVPAEDDEERDDENRKGRWMRKCEAFADQNDLSPREREILMMLAKGHDTEFMQDKLFISKSTIKSHTYNIYKKVDVHSRKELINLIKDMDEDDQKPRRAKKATRS